MTVKITEQNNRLLVRRWAYSAERKRSMPSTVYSVACYKMPEALPTDVIKEHNVTKEEQEQYVAYVQEYKKKSDESSSRYHLRTLKDALEKAGNALDNPELHKDFTLGEMEELSEVINEIKKKITKVKNGKKRKEAKKPKLSVKVS